MDEFASRAARVIFGLRPEWERTAKEMEGIHGRPGNDAFLWITIPGPQADEEHDIGIATFDNEITVFFGDGHQHLGPGELGTGSDLDVAVQRAFSLVERIMEENLVSVVRRVRLLGMPIMGWEMPAAAQSGSLTRVVKVRSWQGSYDWGTYP